MVKRGREGCKYCGGGEASCDKGRCGEEKTQIKVREGKRIQGTISPLTYKS